MTELESFNQFIKDDKINTKEQLKEIGLVCKNYREKNRIKQKEIAKPIGYSPALIQRFEKGEINSAIILYQYIKRGIFNEKEHSMEIISL